MRASLGYAVISGRHTLALYLAAAAVYVAIGVVVPAFLYSSLVAIAYVLLAVWGLPSLLRRLR